MHMHLYLQIISSRIDKKYGKKSSKVIFKHRSNLYLAVESYFNSFIFKLSCHLDNTYRRRTNRLVIQNDEIK